MHKQEENHREIQFSNATMIEISLLFHYPSLFPFLHLLLPLPLLLPSNDEPVTCLECYRTFSPKTILKDTYYKDYNS